MTKNQKLKLLSVIFFVLIIILVGMLIYATTFYNKQDDKTASNTAAATESISQSSAASTANTSAVASQAGQTGAVPDSQQTIELKLYKYDSEDYDKPKEIVNVSIDKKLYEEDLTAALNKLLEPTGLRLNKAEVSGDMITVDLPREIADIFNRGSTSGITNTNILAATMVNLPNITKLEVTVEGVPDEESDHYNFNGTFIRSEGDKPYKFS